MTGSIETAIKNSGISRASYYDWVKQVRAGGGTKLHAKFISTVDRAEAEIKSLVEHILFKHMVKYWRACAWWLERKYPNEYGRRRPLSDPADADPPPQHITWREYPPAAKGEPTPAEHDQPEAPQNGPPVNPERISVEWVPGSYYEKLGLDPIAGRLLQSHDDRPDAPAVAVITDDYWDRRFRCDPAALGRSIRIAGVAVTIVGVCREFGGLPGGQMVDIVMAEALKAAILAGLGVRMKSNTSWTLGAILPTM